MKTRQTLFSLLLIVTVLLAACGGGDSFESVGAPGAAPPMMDAAEEAEAPRADGFGTDDGSIINPANNEQQGTAQERLIIRTGQMDIVVEDTEATLNDIEQLITRLEGWVVSSNVYQYSTAKSGTITVRIPADQYAPLVDQIKALAVEVNSETTNSQDVTEEFVDLSARVANLEATRDRVRTFLEDAKNVEEALVVNQELSRLEGEIESIQGRLQYLSQSAAFSSLTVNITPDIAAQPFQPATWRPGTVARAAVEDLVDALQGLADFLIRVALFVLPLLLVLGLPLFLVVRFARRYWLRRRRPQPIAAPPTN